LKKPRILIFDEATSSLDANTAEHFAATINQLKGKVTMIFITHALPRSLQVDEVVRIGGGSVTTVGLPHDARTAGKPEGGFLAGVNNIDFACGHDNTVQHHINRRPRMKLAGTRHVLTSTVLSCMRRARVAALPRHGVSRQHRTRPTPFGAIEAGAALLLTAFIPAIVSAAESTASTEPHKEPASQQVLRRVLEDIRHCDKSVRYQYDDKTDQINPPELRNIKGLRLEKLYREWAVFEIDDMYEGMHATTLLLRRSNISYMWPMHAVAFEGRFQEIRRRLESFWSIRFEDSVRPGPDVIYSAKYAQFEMSIDKTERVLSITQMPSDVDYPYSRLPTVGCNEIRF
jgi:energy-coupling factor transporter ATP-binding protein EcfA2